jgi:hypothetical protein
VCPETISVFCVLALAGLAATAAKADGVDPTVVIRRVDPPPIAITSPNQTFNILATFTNVNGIETAAFAFQNDTGITLTGLSLDLFPGNLGFVFTCGNFAGLDIFANCASKSGSHGDSLLSFFGVGNGFSGLTAATCTKGGDDDDDQGDNNSQGDDGPRCVGGVYSLIFQAPSSEVPGGAQVRGTGTVSAPEPMTSVLLVSGLLGLAGLRKRRSS